MAHRAAARRRGRQATAPPDVLAGRAARARGFRLASAEGRAKGARTPALPSEGVLYEAITDPEVPPLPPRIKFEQVKKLAMALPGDPARGAIVKGSVKGKIEEFLHR